MLLGIDLGTSAIKAALYRTDGAEVATASVPYPTSRSGPAEEQDPQDWVKAVQQALSQVLSTGRPSAVGVTGQMSGLLLLDEEGTPVYPFLPWSDRRAEAGADALAARFGLTRIYGATGCRPAGSYPAAKLWWLREHHPAVLARARYLMGAREYLVMLLTGARVTDPSAAGATQLFEIRRNTWWQPVLEALRLEVELPDLKMPWELAGLTGEKAVALGLPRAIPVAVGAGDGPCSSWGAGASDPGDVVISIGTSGVVRAIAPEPLIHPMGATTCYPLGGGLFAGTGVTSAAGAALDWVARILGLGSAAGLEAEAHQAPAGAAGALFVPDLSGARTPFWNAAARGAFTGLELSHTRAHLSRAALEGVAMSLVLALEALTEAGGRAERLLLTGGASRNSLLAGSLAGLTGLPVQAARGGDATLGAAQLAAVASGVYPDLSTARRQMTSAHLPVTPIALPPDLFTRYRRAARATGTAYEE